MLGGSIYNLICIIIFTIGIIMMDTAIVSTAIILFILGIILKYVVIGKEIEEKK